MWCRCQELTQLSQPHLGHLQKPKFLSQVKYYILKVFSQPESQSIFFFCPSKSGLSANSPDRVSPHMCNYRAQCRRAHSQLDYYNNKSTKDYLKTHLISTVKPTQTIPAPPDRQSSSVCLHSHQVTSIFQAKNLPFPLAHCLLQIVFI